jgi:hypothetical protein
LRSTNLQAGLPYFQLLLGHKITHLPLVIQLPVRSFSFSPVSHPRTHLTPPPPVRALPPAWALPPLARALLSASIAPSPWFGLRWCLTTRATTCSTSRVAVMVVVSSIPAWGATMTGTERWWR